VEPLRSWKTNGPRQWLRWTRHPAYDIAAGGQWTFDPSNRVYARTLTAICPDLRDRLEWSNDISDNTCGDFIKALLGVWLQCKDGWAPSHDEWEPTRSSVDLSCAAKYWERVTYCARCIFRVRDWYHSTRVQASTTGLRTLSCWEEATITSAIHWAGTYYATKPWQARDPPTTTTSYHDILQST
jgi:hypothetical protein